MNRSWVLAAILLVSVLVVFLASVGVGWWLSSDGHAAVAQSPPPGAEAARPRPAAPRPIASAPIAGAPVPVAHVTIDRTAADLSDYDRAVKAMNLTPEQENQFLAVLYDVQKNHRAAEAVLTEQFAHASRQERSLLVADPNQWAPVVDHDTQVVEASQRVARFLDKDQMWYYNDHIGPYVTEWVATLPLSEPDPSVRD